MFCVLIGVGITQPRGTSIAVWCFLYVVIAVIFNGLVVFALLSHARLLVETLLGVSAGAATGLAIHSIHHVFEERNKN